MPEVPGASRRAADHESARRRASRISARVASAPSRYSEPDERPAEEERATARARGVERGPWRRAHAPRGDADGRGRIARRAARGRSARAPRLRWHDRAGRGTGERARLRASGLHRPVRDALHPRRIHAGPQALSAAVAGVEHRDPERTVRGPPARYTTQPHPGSPRGKLSTRRRLREPIRRAERERATRRKRVPCAERAEVPVAWSAVRASVRKALFPNRTADSAAKRRVPFPSPRRCGGERPGEVCRGRVRSAEAG